VIESVIGTRHLYRIDGAGFAIMHDYLDCFQVAALDNLEAGMDPCTWRDRDIHTDTDTLGQD
jgi:hypothetical protein